MKLWKFVAFFAFLVLRIASCSVKKQCFWVIDAVQKDNILKVASTIVAGGQYLLRIRVNCNGMVRVKLISSHFYFKFMSISSDFVASLLKQKYKKAYP